MPLNRDFIGREFPPSPPYEVGREKIREFATAIGDTNPAYTDPDAAKRAFRDLADKWDEAGKVPRDRVKELEGRFRKVEQAIRSVEDDQWRKSDPEKSARADDMIGKLEAGIAETQAKLDKASAAGDAKRTKDLESELANKQAFLDMARKAAAEFG